MNINDPSGDEMKLPSLSETLSLSRVHGVFGKKPERAPREHVSPNFK